MQRKFLSNIFLVLLLNVLVKPFYILGIDAEFLRRNPDEYGAYFSLLGLTFIFNIFLDLGTNNFNTRNLAQKENLLQKHFSAILTIRSALVFLYMAILLLAGFILGYSNEQFALLALLGINQCLVAFVQYFRSNLSGLLMLKQDSFVSVLDRTLLILMCSIVLWGNFKAIPAPTIWVFVVLQTIAYGLTAIIAAVMVLKKTQRFRWDFDLDFSKKMLKKSLPYALLVLLMMLYYRVDSVMIERMLPNGKREAALYAQGFRFFEAFTMLGFLFAGLLLPIFSKMLKNKQNVSSLTNLSFQLLFSMAIIIGGTVFIGKNEIVQSRFNVQGIELIKSATSFGLLMGCFIAMSVTYIFGTLLTANGSLKILNRIALGGVILNLVLNYYFIPKEGAIGAAWASLTTQVLTAILQVIVAFKIIPIRFASSQWIKISVFLTLFIGCLFVCSPIEIGSIWVKLLLVGIVGVFLALITGMVSIKQTIQLVKLKN